jgi:hypothetical protein
VHNTQWVLPTKFRRVSWTMSRQCLGKPSFDLAVTQQTILGSYKCMLPAMPCSPAHTAVTPTCQQHAHKISAPSESVPGLGGLVNFTFTISS